MVFTKFDYIGCGKKLEGKINEINAILKEIIKKDKPTDSETKKIIKKLNNIYHDSEVLVKPLYDNDYYNNTNYSAIVRLFTKISNDIPVINENSCIL